MVIGIGIDLVEVKRIKQLISHARGRAAAADKNSIARIFTAQEIKYCRSKKNPAESFAARFAAKEAFLKAIGTGWGTNKSPQWTEIEIIPHSARSLSRHRRGTPHSNLRHLSIRLSGKAQKMVRQLGAKRIHLSLTHTKDYAMAVVILEGK